MASILSALENGVLTLTLNRPAVFNSFNREMALGLQAELDRAATDTQVRAVVLTGAGKAFCAGQDLKEVTDPAVNPGFHTILAEHYNPIIQRLRALPKPVLAAVNGVAAGAGANIALACDIVVARSSASFIQAFTKIGLVPDSGGSFVLPRLIGFQRALALAMLGDKVSAQEAKEMGMIYKVMADEAFDEATAALALKLAQMPTQALALTKAAFNQSLHNDLEAQLAVELDYQIQASETADYAEGVAAFLAKRKPVFKGN